MRSRRPRRVETMSGMHRFGSPALVIFLVAISLWAWQGAAPAAAQSLAPVDETMVAPDFGLRDLDGREHRLSSYQGRVLIVNFWATWCPPCREEMPSLQRVREQLHGNGVEVLAVNVGEDEDAILTFTASYPVTFPLLLDEDGRVVDSWPVLGLPTTYVVEPGGRLAYRAVGAREWDDPEIVEQIRTLIAQP